MSEIQKISEPKNLLEWAKTLAARGFHVFPVITGGKTPAIENYSELATTDPQALERWWVDSIMNRVQPFNVGIATTKFNGGKSGLLVVDVDNKNGKKGSETMLALELQGFEFPKTRTQTTPTGGLHLIYKVPVAVKQGTDIFGKGSGLDTRSMGGYVVGAGSEVGAGQYSIDDTPIADAPEWLIEKCGEAPERVRNRVDVVSEADQEQARKRALAFLTTKAEHAVEGASGDQTTFNVCCQMKDLGLTKANAFDILWEHWNPECSPPWTVEDLKQKIDNAYSYSQKKLGADAPESQFSAIETEESEEDAKTEVEETLSPVRRLNKDFAFVIAGNNSHILWETVDDENRPTIRHLAESAFHKKFASRNIITGNGKAMPLTEIWMKSAERRSYDGICFNPGIETPPRFYNLWRGFSVELPKGPPSVEAKLGFDLFMEHARENVCQGDETLFQWLMGYFAHLIQRPWEKPLVALVFRGLKGTGKNAIVNQVGQLIRAHALVTSNRRYLAGNFNSHLENLLLFVLDEAFWSGDKALEGIIKDLITGERHVIEHKGQEPYTVANRTRVVIIGNEDWVVPASEDERRYAVFDIGLGRRQDRIFFTTLVKGMRAGGYSLLLEYFMKFDLKGHDVNGAPATSGLLSQKLESLDPFHQWLFSSISEGEILGLDLKTDQPWPKEVEKEMLRMACQNELKSRNIRYRMPDAASFGKKLLKCFPSLSVSRKQIGGERLNTYVLPDLMSARKDWEIFIGHKIKWEITELPSQK